MQKLIHLERGGECVVCHLQILAKGVLNMVHIGFIILHPLPYSAPTLKVYIYKKSKFQVIKMKRHIFLHKIYLLDKDI